ASPRDPRTPPVPVDRYRDALGRSVAGMTVGVAERFFFEHTQPDIAAPVRDAIGRLREAGAAIVEVDVGWPDPELGESPFYLAEESAAVGRDWPAFRDRLGPDVRRAIEAASRPESVFGGHPLRRRRGHC